jgi:hypothetical protein
MSVYRYLVPDCTRMFSETIQDLTVGSWYNYWHSVQNRLRNSNVIDKKHTWISEKSEGTVPEKSRCMATLAANMLTIFS